jgi:hypothetical protein
VGNGAQTTAQCSCGAAIGSPCASAGVSCLTAHNQVGTCALTSDDNLMCTGAVTHTLLTTACPTELAACQSTGDTGDCALNSELLATPLSGIWALSNEKQALLMCGHVNAVGGLNGTCRSIEIGQISRPVLQIYCSGAIAEGQLSCPVEEHFHCCSCQSDTFPLLPDRSVPLGCVLSFLY